MFRVQDKYIDLKQIQQQITEERKKEGADPIADEADAYGGLTVFEGRAEEQIRQLENQEVRPMVEEMKARDISLEMIDEFAQMRHAPERNAFVAEINEKPATLCGLPKSAFSRICSRRATGFWYDKKPCNAGNSFCSKTSRTNSKSNCSRKSF